MQRFDLSGALIIDTPPELGFDSMALVAANFAGHELEGANFDDADLSGASFQGADLYWSRFYRAKCTGANFAQPPCRVLFSMPPIALTRTSPGHSSAGTT